MKSFQALREATTGRKDVKCSGEKSQFGGYTPTCTKNGKGIYSAQQAYTDADTAKKHAEVYADAYYAYGDIRAQKAVRDFVAKNKSKLRTKDESVEVEEGKLPPHLSKFFDKKGKLNKDAEERVKQGRKKRGLDPYTGKKLKSVKESTTPLSRFETITEGKEESTAIRKILKDKYKLTSRDVGVVNKYGGYSSSVTLTIKTEKALALKDKLDNLSNEFQKYERDYATQEILLGGNTYVFVQMDRKLSKGLEDKIVAQVEKVMKGDPSTDGFDLFKTFHVHFEGKTTYVSGIKGGTSVSAHDKSPFTIANLVLQYIGRNGNPSMYAKIK